MREMRNAYDASVGKPEGNRPLGRPRRGWEGNINIKMNHREIGWGDVDWIHLAQDMGPVAGYCKHGNKISSSIKAGKFCLLAE
jgi:hypothetical protein